MFHVLIMSSEMKLFGGGKKNFISLSLKLREKKIKASSTVLCKRDSSMIMSDYVSPISLFRRKKIQHLFSALELGSCIQY
jgi:hypothetical protein